MSFRLVKPPRIWLQVTVQVPDMEEQATCRLQIDYLNMAARRELLGRIDTDRLQDTDVARELIRDWGGVSTADGDPIPFTADALTQAMDIPYVHDAFRGALLQHLLGDAWLDLAKNFAPLAGNGRQPAASTK